MKHPMSCWRVKAFSIVVGLRVSDVLVPWQLRPGQAGMTPLIGRKCGMKRRKVPVNQINVSGEAMKAWTETARSSTTLC
eukprot:1518727-Amphidinium_carterae.1